MNSTFTYGGPQFGLEDCKIAPNNLDGTFGTLVDVPSIKVMDVTVRVKSQVLEGDDKETASSSRVIGGTVKLQFGSVNLDVLVVMLGGTLDAAYGAYTSRRVSIANRNTPYLGICGRADAAEGAGDTHLFIPKAKIASDFSLKFEFDTFSIPEITLTAQGDENFLDDNGDANIIIPIEYETARPVAIPPV